jgi:hypothetical protein
MLNWLYGTNRYPASGGDPGQPGSLCQEYPGSVDGIKDCSPAFNRRRTAAGLDSQGLGSDAHELESLDKDRECRGVESFEEQAQTREAVSADAPDRARGGTALRAIASGIWPEPGPLGWPHLGRALKTSVRVETEGAAGPNVDASAGISLETGQLFVSAGPGGRSEAVSPRVKKNFRIWVLGRRWFFKMKRVLPCIPGWDGGGPREDILFASLPPANITSGLIFRVGWHRFWDDTE